MNSVKYIGMDVHKEAISIAVLNFSGKLVMECMIETKAITILDFLKGLRGSLHVTFEEGTWAAWLYDLIKPHVTELIVCDPRRNALLKEGSKSDRIDARKLAELLRSNMVRSVYHGEHGVRALKELARSYLTISKDLLRVMTRLKAIYRSWGIPCTGKQVYASRYRAEWLAKISEAGVHRRAEILLPAVRCVEGITSGSPARAIGRGSEAQGVEIVTSDSIHRTDPGRSADRFDPDTTPVPHQATAVDIQRVRNRDTQQCRAAFHQGRAETCEEAGLDSRSEPKSQSRSKELIQECCNCGLCQAGSVSGVLRCRWWPRGSVRRWRV